MLSTPSASSLATTPSAIGTGTALLSMGVPPPQAASKTLAAISVSTKPFRLILSALIILFA